MTNEQFAKAWATLGPATSPTQDWLAKVEKQFIKELSMHDKNGTELKVGDVVLIQARIKDLSATEDYCNCTLETIHARRPDSKAEVIAAINTAVTVLFKRSNE